MVIVLATQKGGAGKSTIAINLAHHLLNKGSVLIIDSDKQATISESDFIEQLEIIQQYGDLEKSIKKYKTKYKYIIIDVAGKDSKELRSSLMNANIAIIPFLPSQSDLYTVNNINNIINDANVYNKKLKTFALINNASTHKANKRPFNAKYFIKENSRMQPLNTVLHTRNVYLDTFQTGKTVLQTKDSKAKNEFNNLVEELEL
jgi:chromosome partitioning protein